MLKLDNIADYIEKNNIFGGRIFVGKLYGTKDNVSNEKIIAIYNAEAKSNTAIGGLSSYNHKAIKILVHWNKNYAESEKTANEIYQLFNNNEVNINGVNCIMQTKYSEAVCINTDDYNIWEFVIYVEIIYKEV